MLKETCADIIGMQEVLNRQLNDLKVALPEYNSIGVGRRDGQEAGEYSPLFYKSGRFTEKRSGNFWLSEDPAAVGMKGWDANCERIATWAVLKENGSGKDFFVLSTHFDHIGVVARRESAKLILEKIGELAGNLPSIVMGDFNVKPDSEAVQTLTGGGSGVSLTHSKAIAETIQGPDWSFHSFGKLPEEKRALIDYIFVSPQIMVSEYSVLPERNEEGFFSDHSAVSATVRVK